MNPPPPIFPAAGSTTARANAVATAASTALPPCFMMSTPTCEPSVSSVATIPCSLRICGGRNRYGNRCENERDDAGCFLEPRHEQETLSDSRESVKAVRIAAVGLIEVAQRDAVSQIPEFGPVCLASNIPALA